MSCNDTHRIRLWQIRSTFGSPFTRIIFFFSPNFQSDIENLPLLFVKANHKPWQSLMTIALGNLHITSNRSVDSNIWHTICVCVCVCRWMEAKGKKWAHVWYMQIVGNCRWFFVLVQVNREVYAHPKSSLKFIIILRNSNGRHRQKEKQWEPKRERTS